MLIFAAPGARPNRSPGSARVLPGLANLIEAASSRLPEHATVRDDVVALNLRSRALAEQFAAALPDELQDFWAAYSGWFSIYSVGPLLANQRLAAGISGPERSALVLENWRSAGWWSGRELLSPAVADVLADSGLQVQIRPGRALRRLRGTVANLVAARLGRLDVARQARGARRASRDASLAPASPCDVLWLGVGASSVELINALSPALHRLGLRSQVLDFDYFGSREAMQRCSAPHNDIAAFMTAAHLAAARDLRRQLPSWWPQIAARAGNLPLHAELKRSQFEALLDRLRIVLTRDAPAWHLHSLAAQAALEVYQPRVVAGFHVYGPVIAPMIVAARHANLPRVCLQHGVIGPRYLALPCLPYDEKLVFGTYAASIMAQSRHPDMHVTATGHCLYDRAQAPVTPGPEVLALREGVEALVVLCTQFNEESFYDRGQWWMAEVARACRQLNARLVLKLHPSDSKRTIRLYRTLLAPDDDCVLLIQHGQYPLSELLAACDLMVTRDSTVVFEANLLGKPTTTINLSHLAEEVPYADTGGALGVYRHEDIVPAIRSALHDRAVRQHLASRRPRFLLEHTGPSDGHATDRIAAAIARWAP